MLISPKTGVRAGLTTSLSVIGSPALTATAATHPPASDEGERTPWTRAVSPAWTFTSRVLPEPTDEPAGTGSLATTTVVSAERSCSAAYAKPPASTARTTGTTLPVVHRRGRPILAGSPSAENATVAGREVGGNCSVRSMGHHHRQTTGGQVRPQRHGCTFPVGPRPRLEPAHQTGDQWRTRQGSERSRDGQGAVPRATSAPSAHRRTPTRGG